MQRQQRQQGSAEVFDRRSEEQNSFFEEQQLEEHEGALLELLDEGTGREPDVQLLRAQHVGRQAGVQVLVGLLKEKEKNVKCKHQQGIQGVLVQEYTLTKKFKPDE
jgi:hypothetical protein